MLGVQLVLIVLFAFLGYREAAKFEREHGRGPFGIPPWGWAAITGFSLIIGAVLLAIARRQAKNAPVPAPVSAPVAVAPPAVFGSSFDLTGAPAAPPREDLWAAPTPVATSPAAPALPPAPAPPAPAPATPAPAASFAPSAAAVDILPGR
jgi:hypothetical protein